MNKFWVIACREYRAIVGTKAFLVAIIMMPILMGGGIAAQIFLQNRVGPTEKKIVVLDATGTLFDELAKSAQERNTEILAKGKQIDRAMCWRIAPPRKLPRKCAMSYPSRCAKEKSMPLWKYPPE